MTRLNQTLTVDQIGESAEPRTRRAPVWDAVVLAVLALVIGAAFSWVPSVWYDEAATISASTRSWAALWSMLQNVDAVHGVYYSGMHIWFDIVGYSPFTLRFPSAIAGAGAVGLTVALARRIGGRRIAVLSGVVLILIPRMVWASGEGRSYAFTVLLTAASTMTLLAAARVTMTPGSSPPNERVGWWRLRWVLYALISMLSIAVFAYLALLVVVHAVTMFWLLRARLASRRAWMSFLATSIATLIGMAPFLSAVRAQSGQVAWIHPLGSGTLTSLAVTQFFLTNTGLAVIVWVLTGVGIAVLLRRGRSRTKSGEAVDVTGRAGNQLILAVAVPLLIVPASALLAASAAVSPLYSPRYLTFTVPAVALLAGSALAALRSRRLLAAALVVLVLVCTPTIVAQRLVEAKQESSWSEVAATIGGTEKRSDVGRTGVVFGRVAGHPAATARVMAYAYPAAFAGLADPGLTTPITVSDHLWETQGTVTTGQLQNVDSVWTISSDRSRMKQRSTTATVLAAGFHEDARWHFSRVDLVLYRR